MLIDCDVHPKMKRGENLLDYMPAAFHNRYRQEADGLMAIYPPPNGGRRLDSFPDDGNPSGSVPELFEKQLFGDAGVDYAIHLCDAGGASIDPSLDAAIKGGINTWMARKWVGEYNAHGRYRSSICIGMGDPDLAVREIEKWAGHPYIVQVLGNPKVQVPFGNRQYHPIWEAAARHNLPFAMHKASIGLPAMQTPVGYCSYYAEEHACAEATAYVAHLLSFICEGVFDKYPDFKVVCVEGGFSWVGPLLWRLEKAWTTIRREFPNARRRPADYLYDNVRFTSQPIEEPERRRDLVRLFNMIDAGKLLLFSTDYPHWDYDDPRMVLPFLPEGAHDRVAYRNAAELYGIAVN